MRSYLVPLVFGIGGFAVLVALGYWQLRRLEWKSGLVAEIEARIAAAPVALPRAPDPLADRYLAVHATGAFDGEGARILTVGAGGGGAFRIVSAFVTGDGRRILVDRGIARDDTGSVARAPARVTGNLVWPDEADGFTPAPDLASRVWYARDVPALAEALATEPVLVVARRVEPPDPGIVPEPPGAAGIPNNHLGYAIQWFGLAAVWAGMTLYLLWRIHRRTV